ncbi:MAG: shikimate kinase [Candidatus Gastranaerophilales bacterium]|nr:shikimate kinase [Candidatus Gastranaerophilales bacterium]
MEAKDNLNIVLAGMPGAGKTYIGSKLAKLLAHFSYIDTDEEIKKETGLEITEIFENHSEKYFRELELEIIKKVSKERNQIISIGGGAFENHENVKELKKNGLVFYLEAPAKELFARIKNETHRPLLNEDFSLKTVEKLLRKREKNYFKADFIINTYQKPAYTILDDILSEYDNYVKQRTFC